MRHRVPQTNFVQKQIDLRESLEWDEVLITDNMTTDVGWYRVVRRI